MKDWQVTVVLHRRPGSPVIVTGVAADSPGEAYGAILSRLGPPSYGGDFTITEIPPPEERHRED